MTLASAAFAGVHAPFAGAHAAIARVTPSIARVTAAFALAAELPPCESSSPVAPVNAAVAPLTAALALASHLPSSPLHARFPVAGPPPTRSKQDSASRASKNFAPSPAPARPVTHSLLLLRGHQNHYPRVLLRDCDSLPRQARMAPITTASFGAASGARPLLLLPLGRSPENFVPRVSNPNSPLQPSNSFLGCR